MHCMSMGHPLSAGFTKKQKNGKQVNKNTTTHTKGRNINKVHKLQ